MEGLPKLPGLDFENRVKLRYNLSHCLEYINGYRMPKKPLCGIGGDSLKEDSIAYCNPVDPILYDPVLTYGRVKQPPVEPFRPRFVLYDKKVLTFKAFFRQSVPESPIEHYRTRFVNIIYFLEDDTITVMEPPVINCGFPQGRLLKRDKIPKNIAGQFYSWKDFNIGMDIQLFGFVFHITDCDPYTTEFLLSQGIELNDSECPPIDPVTTERLIDCNTKWRKTPQNDDKLRRYLEFQGKVLHFDCVLDETDIPFGECMSFKLYYYLEDDTVAIKELKENREGRDHFPMLLRKTKLPKNWKRRPVDYPSIILELSDKEVDEYYQPKDFRIGGTVFVLGRRFLLLDCDKFTRQYYAEVLKQPQEPKLAIEFPEQPTPKRSLPTYLGLGTPEDSLASVYGLMPKPPKKDVINLLLNANKFLRYGCVLDNIHPEDEIRRFILCYSLSDNTISINEPTIRNSGIKGGKFLAASRIWKPFCDPDNPEYYSPKDIFIGTILTINNHRFKIISADLYVYRYMQEHSEMFTQEAIDSVRNYHLINGNLKEDLKIAMMKDCKKNLEHEKQSELKHSASPDMDICLTSENDNANTSTISREPIHPDTTRNESYNLKLNECPYYMHLPTALEQQKIDDQRTSTPDNKYLAEPCAKLGEKKCVRFLQ